MNTSCRDCVFAEYEGKKQVQCKLDRLEKMQEQGTIIIEQKDNKKTYFEIQNRVCMACRHPSSLKGVPARKWEATVREQMLPRVALTVYSEGDFDKTIRSLQSCIRQTKRPYEIVLIYNGQGQLVPTKYLEWFAQNANTYSWFVETMQIPGLSYYEAIDECMQAKHIKSLYFVVCHAGYEFVDNYIEKIDESFNVDLDRFVMLLPEDDEGNGIFIQKGLFNFVGGNKGDANVMEKIKSIADYEKTSHLIKKFKDL